MNPEAVYLDEDGQIPHGLIDDLLVEVVSGKFMFEHEGDLYASRHPTSSETERARVMYAKTMHKACLKGLLTRTVLERTALEMGAIEKKDRDEKKSIVEMIDRWTKARDMTQDVRQRLRLDGEMEGARKRLMELEMKEVPIFRHAAETFALEAKNDYFVACVTLGGEMLDVPIWASWDDFQNCNNWGMIHVSREAFHRVNIGLPSKVVRALSRTNEWRMKWKACVESGATPFEDPSSTWDRNKRNLIYWSNFYDQIYQHPDCPDENTVADDEALQTWLNYQIVERNKNKARNPQRRPSPTYRVGNERRPMTKIGQDKVTRVNQPYKIRAN